MAFAHPSSDNRVSRHLAVEVPIVQAPMGWIARSQLASAVSRAGACGIIETSSGEIEAVKAGRIDSVRPVADIIADTVREFGEVVARLAGGTRMSGVPS